MKLNDLLDMLRTEFALDMPATLETLNLWQACPDEVPATLPDMLSFLDRSVEVVQIVGMKGFAGFLLDFMKYFLHPTFFQRSGNQIIIAHRNSTRKN